MNKSDEGSNVSDSFMTGQAEGIAQQKEKSDKNILKNIFVDTGLTDDIANARME